MAVSNGALLKQFISRMRSKHPNINLIRLTEMVFQSLQFCIPGENILYGEKEYKIIRRIPKSYIIGDSSSNRIQIPFDQAVRNIERSRNGLKKLVEEEMRLKPRQSDMQTKFSHRKRPSMINGPRFSNITFDEEKGRFVTSDFKSSPKNISGIGDLNSKGIFNRTSRSKAEPPTIELEEPELNGEEFKRPFLQNIKERSTYFEIFSFFELYMKDLKLTEFNFEIFDSLILDMGENAYFFFKFFFNILADERKKVRGGLTKIIENVLLFIFKDDKDHILEGEKHQWFNQKINRKNFMMILNAFLYDIKNGMNLKNIIDYSLLEEKYSDCINTMNDNPDIEIGIVNRLKLFKFLIEILCETSIFRNISERRFELFRNGTKDRQYHLANLRKLRHDLKREKNTGKIEDMRIRLQECEDGLKELENRILNDRYMSNIGTIGKTTFLIFGMKELMYEKDDRYYYLGKDRFVKWLRFKNQHNKGYTLNEELTKLNFFFSIIERR